MPDDNTDSTRFLFGDGDGRRCDNAAQLVLIQGRDTGRVVEIDRPELAIGRHPDNDLVLNSQMVSRRHARVLQQAGRFCVEDLGSRNGILLNGKKLASRSRHPVRHKDVLQLCDCQLLFLECDERHDVGRLATIHLDQSQIGREADELLKKYLQPPDADS